MSSRILSICALLASSYMVQTSSNSPGITPRPTPTKIYIGLPPIATTPNSFCAVEGTISAPYALGTFTYSDPIQCQQHAFTLSRNCYFIWEPSTGACSPYVPLDSCEFNVTRGHTGLFYSAGRDCYSIPVVKDPSSAPFPEGLGNDIYVNTGISDCGVEGTGTTDDARGPIWFSDVLGCSNQCQGDDTCWSYAWNPSDLNSNCMLFGEFLGDFVTQGKSGVYYSDSTGKMSNDCFRNGSFVASKIKWR